MWDRSLLHSAYREPRAEEFGAEMSSWQAGRLWAPWTPDAQPEMLSMSYCSGEHQEHGPWEAGLNGDGHE